IASLTPSLVRPSPLSLKPSLRPDRRRLLTGSPRHRHHRALFVVVASNAAAPNSSATIYSKPLQKRGKNFYRLMFAACYSVATNGEFIVEIQ
ncbi:unnamed protein product, partial [Lactuca virosa]